MAKPKRRVFILGDLCKASALVGGYELLDERLTADNPNFYQVNAAWDNVPTKYKVPARTKLLYGVVKKMAKKDNRARYGVEMIEDSRGPFQGEYTRWRLSGNKDTAWCDGVIGRYQLPCSEAPIKVSTNLQSIETRASDVIAMYCVSDGAGDHGLRDSIGFFENAGFIVLRTNAEMFGDAGSFPGELLNDSSFEVIAGKTIAIVTIDSLRRASLNIRKGLSWEQVIQETLEEMQSISALSRLGCIIVTFKNEGCLLWFPQNNTCEVLCYPSELEGSFAKECRATPFAAMATFQAAIVDGLATADVVDKGFDDEKLFDVLCDAAELGIRLTRALLTKGFDVSNNRLCFPYEKLVKWVDDPESGALEMNGFSISPDVIPDGFSILRSQLSRDDMIGVAREYVRGGREAIEEYVAAIPYFEMGDLLTFERDEIEQFNNLQNLLMGYAANHAAIAPLSICVFGSPGAGKSFAVKQIAQGVDRDRFHEFFEFNLSQMVGYSDLAGAFHRVADARLKGGIPVVFFDEFDANFDGTLKFGWLKNFLAPMQDGIYTDRGNKFAIGKAVFVFAGGTCNTHSRFVKEALDAREAKGKDFLSRVNGYVDIIGINPDGEKQEIPYLKRAVLLRSLITRKMNAKPDDWIEIDDKVLNAFLLVAEYYHDARSMEAIVATSSVSKNRRFLPSSIENNCLDLHVPREFRERLRAAFIGH